MSLVSIDVREDVQLSKSRGKKILPRLVLALITSAFALVTWYRVHYSMSVAHAFEVAGSPAEPRVLIATQGSAFKDGLTTGLVEHLRHRAAYVKVIDVSGLDGVQPTDWDAIVVIHTWEMHKAPAVARTVVDRMQAKDKLVVLTTSGAGNVKLAGVEAISAASRMSDIPARVTEMAVRIDAIVDRAPSRSESVK